MALRRVKSPGTVVTVDCELPEIDSEKQILVPFKSSKSSYPLSFSLGVFIVILHVLPNS